MKSTSYSIPYGKSSIRLPLAKEQWELILPRENPSNPNPLETVVNSLRNPIRGKGIKKAKTGFSVGIAINDKSRPVPHEQLLPPLLQDLSRAGYENAQIRFFIANGTHTPMRPDEYPSILPQEILDQYLVYSHDCDDSGGLRFLGETRKGTPVHINRDYYDSNIKIVVGNIEPHHFMGFSGGVKSAAIGLAGRQTININHRMLIDPEARIGEINQNPTRSDAEEIGSLIGIDHALNAILDQNREISHVLFGEPRDVMEYGVPLSRSICQTPVHKSFDLVIAAPGGYPKDINLYQSQKALSHASLITRDGGTVILVAECIEGVGNQEYVDFMASIKELDQVFIKIDQVGFSIGPHKALQFARELRRINLVIVSSIDFTIIHQLCLTPAYDLQEAIQIARKITRPIKEIAVLPKAINTIPVLL